MKDLTRIVIPRIATEWKDVALSLDYEVHTIMDINEHSKDLKECCYNLFLYWLETNCGRSPKSWHTLLSSIREVRNLTTTAEEIEKELLTS